MNCSIQIDCLSRKKSIPKEGRPTFTLGLKSKFLSQIEQPGGKV